MRREHGELEEELDQEEAIQAVGESQAQPEAAPEIDKLMADIEAMAAELAKLRTDAAESHDRYLRTLADFDNFRKRQREDTARQISIAREALMLKILPIIDNFERALAAAQARHSYDSLVVGVQLTLKQIQDTLRSEGVEPIEAEGREFDPELHEAMMRAETDEHPDNTVIDELEKGYTMDGRVIRPARVRVAASE